MPSARFRGWCYTTRSSDNASCTMLRWWSFVIQMYPTSSVPQYTTRDWDEKVYEMDVEPISITSERQVMEDQRHVARDCTSVVELHQLCPRCKRTWRERTMKSRRIRLLQLFLPILRSRRPRNQPTMLRYTLVRVDCPWVYDSRSVVYRSGPK
jgi:hypothetical protein